MRNQDDLKLFFNWSTSEIECSISKNVLIDKKGNLKIRTVDPVAIDLESGELQITTPSFGEKKSKKQSKTPRD